MEPFQRDLVRGSLDLLVLSVLAEEPRYGYLIQKRVQEATSHQVRMLPGTLYPLLHRMEAEKLVRCRWEETTGRPRKWYEITAAGRRRLVEQAHDWTRFVDCVRRFIAPVVDLPPEPA